jgi:hypothetical protein
MVDKDSSHKIALTDFEILETVGTGNNTNNRFIWKSKTKQT